MSTSQRSPLPAKPSLPFILLTLLLCTAWLVGGASRADALGQVVIRVAAWVALVVALLMAPRPAHLDARPVAILLLAATLLVLAQLVPLPPTVWQGLSGRAMFAEAAAVSGQAQPWRPLAIVPAAALNAAASLIVPITILVLVMGLAKRERSWLPGLLLVLIAISMLVGLLQFAGAGFNNPFVNDTPGQVSGTFANRNHFALFLAMGCLITPVWPFFGGRRSGWRGPIALGLVLLLALTILASGSRAGMIVGLLGIAFGLFLARHGVKRELRSAPRWVFSALIAAIVGVIVIFVLISVVAGRAESINRIIAVDAVADMRSRGMPTVLEMVRLYLPWGSGFGGFDPLFRIHEPFELLKFTYFNHAHNDFLEVVLDGGLPALFLLVAGLAWWLVASIKVWRSGSGFDNILPKVGSVMLLLILLASTVDYPARTPTIMAMMVISGLWLGETRPKPHGSSLPRGGQYL